MSWEIPYSPHPRVSCNFSALTRYLTVHNGSRRAKHPACNRRWYISGLEKSYLHLPPVEPFTHVLIPLLPDIPMILQFINELAEYENALHEVEATVSSLRETLSFPDSPPKRGSVYTFLVTPPPPATGAADADKTPEPPKPVGMALFFYNYSTWRSAPGVYLEDIYVQPAYRGKGYGFKLFQRLADEVCRVGGKRLEWVVLNWNEPSIKFYKGIGAASMDEWTKMSLQGDALLKLAGRQEGATG